MTLARPRWGPARITLYNAQDWTQRELSLVIPQPQLETRRFEPKYEKREEGKKYRRSVTSKESLIRALLRGSP